jgi:hypothetical protein
MSGSKCRTSKFLTLFETEHVYQLNVWNKTELANLKINAHLDRALAHEAEGLFWKYKDKFSWTYADLKEILPYVAPHYIELEKDVLPVHPTYYWMIVPNTNIVE